MGQTKKTNVISRVSAYVFAYKLLFGDLGTCKSYDDTLSHSTFSNSTVLDNVFAKGVGSGNLLIQEFYSSPLFFCERVAQLSTDSN